LKEFAYRHSWVEAYIKNGIAFQIRTMRKAKGWDQKELAENALGKSELQSMISRYENPDYGKYSLRTLLDLAKTFDVGLIVRFAPFSELVEWEHAIPKTNLAVPSFDNELESGKLASLHVASLCLAQQPLTSNTVVWATWEAKGAEAFYRPVERPILNALPILPMIERQMNTATFGDRKEQHVN
jgi:transcriptional regulator with XRE-family HTH domain